MQKFYARSINFHFLKNFHTARTNVSTPIMNSHKPIAIAPHLSRLDNNSTRRLPSFSSTSAKFFGECQLNLRAKTGNKPRPSTNQASRTPSPFFLAKQCQTTPSDCLSHFLPTALLPPTLPSQPPPSHTVHSPTPTQPTTCTTVTTSPPKGRRKEK